MRTRSTRPSRTEDLITIGVLEELDSDVPRRWGRMAQESRVPQIQLNRGRAQVASRVGRAQLVSRVGRAQVMVDRSFPAGRDISATACIQHPRQITTVIANKEVIAVSQTYAGYSDGVFKKSSSTVKCLWVCVGRHGPTNTCASWIIAGDFSSVPLIKLEWNYADEDANYTVLEGTWLCKAGSSGRTSAA